MILRRLSQAIRRQDWFTVVVEFVIVVPTSSIATDSFDELVSAGKLGLIRDAETRRMIMTAYAAHTQSGDQIALLTNAVREIAVGISPYVQWQLGDGGSWPGGYRCLFDFKGMAGDPIAMSRLVQLARGQQNYAHFRQIEADAAAAALRRLSPPGKDDTR